MTAEPTPPATARRKDRRRMEQAYEQLKWRIITLELQPGQRIDEGELIEEMGLSRTPIREALFRLASEGLVSIAARSGFVVRPLSLTDVAALLEVEMALAKPVAALAAARATPADVAALERAARAVDDAVAARDYPAFTSANADFHRAEAEATGNAHLRELSAGVLDQLRRVAYLCFDGAAWDEPALAAELAEHSRHHAELIAACVAHDPVRAQEVAAAAAELFRAHVQARLAAPSALAATTFAVEQLAVPPLGAQR